MTSVPPPTSPRTPKGKGRQQGARARARLIASANGAAGPLLCPPARREAMIDLFQRGRYRECEELARSMLLRYPEDGYVWKVLGAAVQAQDNKGRDQQGQDKQGRDRLKEALEIKRRAAALLPDDFEAHNNLGSAFFKLKQYENAEPCYRAALALRPQSPDIWNNLGITLQRLVQFEEAERHCRHALALRPVFADASANLGVILQQLGRPAEAEDSYRAAIAADPSHSDAWNSLGATLQRVGRLTEAEAAHRQAIRLKPEYADAHTNLAGCLQQQGRLAEAEVCYRRSIELDPDCMNSYTNLLFCLSHSGEIEPRALFAEHLRFAQRFEAPLKASWQPHPNSRDPDRVLRVGFVSADFREHAMSHFLEPLFEQLARDPTLELHAYGSHVLEDAASERLRRYIPGWNRVLGVSDAALAERIRADGIDILIDLSGHTGGNRLMAFARKPAPVQCGWIGYLGTSGLECMDYYLADHHLLPPGRFDPFFTEKIAHMPIVAVFPPGDSPPPVNRLPALANGHLTFASFSRMGKLSPAVAALWSRLLRTLPTARMLLGGMPRDGHCELLAGWFAAEGIAPERLEFHTGTGLGAYLEMHHRIDLCLDPFPYTGATTTGHALWMGVPTLTLAGETAPGRLGAAMLHAAGLGAFVAADREDFVRRGLYWGRNLDQLAGLRKGMRAQLHDSALGRPAAMAAGFAATLRRLWREWCANGI